MLEITCVCIIIKVVLFLSPQLCLLSKCMKPALQFLDIDITDISKEVRYVRGEEGAQSHLCRWSVDRKYPSKLLKQPNCPRIYFQDPIPTRKTYRICMA